nr:hypothetical protein [Aneurinibacillus tyrosinisolvens]
MKEFHCCATCKNFTVEKNDRGINYFCKRLGYNTNPNYRFDCWDPKENVSRLMEKQVNKR